jgi:hypothetical protein
MKLKRFIINKFVIWGGFSVNNATLNRFFSLHFLLPFVLAALVLMHLIALHDGAGSSNPVGVSGNYDRLPALCLRKPLLRVKLSKYGNPLKLLVPSDSRKIISRPLNYWCTVISQKIIEKEMGYRVSKSIALDASIPFKGTIEESTIVKEQRVYGS